MYFMTNIVFIIKVALCLFTFYILIFKMEIIQKNKYYYII